jgi:hypothetical protein
VTRHERRGRLTPNIHLSNSQLADIRPAKISASIEPFSEGGERFRKVSSALRALFAAIRWGLARFLAPRGAAPPGTPVRARFCTDLRLLHLSILSMTNTRLRVALIFSFLIMQKTLYRNFYSLGASHA